MDMKKHMLLRTLAGALVLAGFGGLSSCSDDEEPVFGKPELAVTGDATVIAKPGGPFEVDLALTAEGGPGSLIVRRGGGFLEEIPLDPTVTAFTYQGETEATVTEGDEIAYEFVLVNRQDLESDPVSVIVNIETYDKITIGTTPVFEVTIPAGGIVPTGATVKFSEGRSYFIGGNLIFNEGTSLTVEPGVTVYMSTQAAEPPEINLVGASVNVQGTASSPIVITSDKVLRGESPAPGNWDQFRLENVQNATVRYVRIEYAADALRLVNLAANNIVEYIQAFKASTRGFYFTNGAVNARYLYAVDCRSTNIRLGDAYAGRLQFVISNDPIYHPEIEELDIRETAAPTLANITIIGPGTASTPNNTHGVRLRASSAGKIYNAIVTQFPRRGVRLNDQVVTSDLTGPTVFAYSFVFNVPTDPFREDRTSPNNTNPFPGSFDATTGARLTNPFFNNVTNRLGSVWTLSPLAGIGVDDFIPDSETVSAFNPTTLGSFFVSAPFVGAIRDNTTASDWTKGWAKNLDGTIR